MLNVAPSATVKLKLPSSAVKLLNASPFTSTMLVANSPFSRNTKLTPETVRLLLSTTEPDTTKLNAGSDKSCG